MRVCQAAEYGLAEQLVAHVGIEIIDETVLHGLARRSVMPFNPVFRTLAQDSVTRQFRAIAANNHAGPFAALDKGHQSMRQSTPRDQGARDRSEAFSGDGVDNVKDPETLTICELVMGEIQRALGRGLTRIGACVPTAFRLPPSAFRLPPSHRQPFLSTWQVRVRRGHLSCC